MLINFNSSSTEILLNPRIDPEKRAHLTQLVKTNTQSNPQFQSHIFIASSGTTQTKKDDFKMVALSKRAILTSAHAVNQHLQATSQDIWLNSLPEFHVGGLGILARSFLTGSQVIPLEKWNPQEFTDLITSHSVTLTSLVPAQVYDLSLLKIRAPKTLRAVIVGGGAINNELHKQANDLGWPLLLSYGLTECSSQVATSNSKSTELNFLNHIEAKVNSQNYLMIKSEALLTAYLFISGDNCEISDPKKDGWLTTEDLSSINGRTLTILGRSNDFIKIGGEGVLFSHLEKRFEEIKLQCSFTKDAALVAFPDDRLGFVVHLATTCLEINPLVEKFNSTVMPYERIRHIHVIDKIPRTALNKLCKVELLTALQNKILR